MIKVGITGQAGFIGTHLYNSFGLQATIERVNFDKSFLNNSDKLEAFVAECDVIVHLAAMNRHIDPKVIYDTNIYLVNQLIAACEKRSEPPHILFSSSTQEESDNPYGKSKLLGRELLENWAQKSGAKVTGLVIPNVFGPFGKPFYNSVVATFCHQLTHGASPTINVDSSLKLIYINELVETIYKTFISLV